MQRRAVAVYVALFVFVGVAAGGLIVTADAPEVTFDDPDYELSEGDTFEVDGQEYTVTSITETEEEGDEGETTTTFTATIEWEGPDSESESIEIEGDERITLGDTDFIAHVQGADELVLSTDIEGYEAQLAEIERQDQQAEGLWRVLIISLFSAVLVTGVAFIPSRY